MSDGLSFDLTLDYPGFELRMSADLPGHGITAIVGPSGAGKTTLLQAIAGLERARGHVTLDGRALHPLPAHRRGVGVVFQNARLFGHLDVAGNIAFGARRRGTPDAQVDRIVAALDLAPLLGRAVTRLSGGETRRVALARALAASPDLLLLDEPLSGLDPARRAEILPYLARAIRSAGCPALYVTHDRSEALSLADRTIAVSAGAAASPEPGAPVLPLTAVAGAPDRLALDGVSLSVPHRILDGETWGLALDPAHTLLSGKDSVTFDGIAVRATVEAIGSGGLVLRVADRSISWALPERDGDTLRVGDACRLWTKTPVFKLLSGA